MPTHRVSAEEALSVVEPGMTLCAASLSAEPVVLLEALAKRCAQGVPVRLVSGMFLDGYEALGHYLGNEITLLTWFMPQTLLGDIPLGPNVEFLPLTWTQTHRFIGESSPDVCLIQVSEPDANGFHSVGISASVTRLMAERSRVVVAQVNAHMPYTTGDTLIHESEIDYLVEQSTPLRAFPHRPCDDQDMAIARNIVELIPDRALVQSGIGTIPEAVLHELGRSGKSDLRLTSQLTDAGRELIESGRCVAEGPAAVVGEVLGSAELYRWVEHNPRVELRHALHTHGLLALAEQRPFVSINSTLEVDLYGQLNSEVVKAGQAGGIGGSVDFMMAAQMPENLSIIALPSTTSRGKPRIVPVINRGLVTVPRSLVQFVVTEYGVADLRGKTANERARALIDISHPDHKDELESAV